MLFAFGHLFLEEEFGPGAMENGLVGVFEEALMEEVGPAPAAMDPVLVFAAALGDRSNAAVLLNGGGTLVAGALAAEGTAEPGCEGGPGAGEALPDGGIGMGPQSSPMRAAKPPSPCVPFMVSLSLVRFHANAITD